MAKRFTETLKWSDPWYRRLAPSQKLAWDYLCDNCDGAGVIDLDRELANYRIGDDVDWDAFLESAGSRCEVITKGKIWLVGFVEFQYGTLSESCRPHRPVIALLRKYRLYQRVLEQYQKGSDTAQDKDKDKDKEQDKDKEGGCKGETAPEPTPFDEFWEHVPNKVGKTATKSAYRAAVKSLHATHDDPHGYLLDRMTAFAGTPKAKGEFCPHPATWLNQGRYDDDPATWQRGGNARGSPSRAPVALGASHVYDPNSETRDEI